MGPEFRAGSLAHHWAVCAGSWYGSRSDSSETGDRDLVFSPVAEGKRVLHWYAVSRRASNTLLQTGVELQLWVALSNPWWIYCLNDISLKHD